MVDAAVVVAFVVVVVMAVVAFRLAAGAVEIPCLPYLFVAGRTDVGKVGTERP